MTSAEPINDNSIPTQKSLETGSFQKDQIELVTKNYNKAEKQQDETANLIKLADIDKALQLLLADYIEENLGKTIESSLRLRGGEGTNFNIPASCDQTPNGLTIIINIPPIWENSTGEAAGESRGFNLFNVLGKGEEYLKKGINLYTGLGDTPLNADNIVKASEGALASTFGFGGFGASPFGAIGGLGFRSAPIGNVPPSGDSEYCSPGCAGKRDPKVPTSTPKNARCLDVEPMDAARGFDMGILPMPDKYKHQIADAYNTAKNAAEQGREVFSSLGGVGSRSAAISTAQTPEADARGFGLPDFDKFKHQFNNAYNKIDKTYNQFDKVYSTAKNVAEQGHGIVASIGDVRYNPQAVNSAAVDAGRYFSKPYASMAQLAFDVDESANAKPVGDIGQSLARMVETFTAAPQRSSSLVSKFGVDQSAYANPVTDIADKIDRALAENEKSIEKIRHNRYKDALAALSPTLGAAVAAGAEFGGVGSRSATISNAQTLCECSEADARGFNIGGLINTADKYKGKLDTAYNTVKNVAEQGRDVISGFGSVGSRGAPIADAKSPYVSSETDPRGLKFSAGLQAGYDVQYDNTHTSAKQVQKHFDYSSDLGGVGSRSAAISNAQTLCDCSEADSRGLSFGDIINKADQYKHQFDTTYNTVKNISEQGNSLVNSFRGVGARGAPIADVKTPFISSESDPRGFNFPDALTAVDEYKHKMDDVYNIGKSIAEQGHAMYDTLKDVGLRSAAITNQSQGEDYCTPCGKQNASQMDSIKEQLNSAEARDSLIIDQVRQQQQARRKKVTQMLGNR